MHFLVIARDLLKRPEGPFVSSIFEYVYEVPKISTYVGVDIVPQSSEFRSANPHFSVGFRVSSTYPYAFMVFCSIELVPTLSQFRGPLYEIQCLKSQPKAYVGLSCYQENIHKKTSAFCAMIKQNKKRNPILKRNTYNKKLSNGGTLKIDFTEKILFVFVKSISQKKKNSNGGTIFLFTHRNAGTGSKVTLVPTTGTNRTISEHFDFRRNFLISGSAAGFSHGFSGGGRRFSGISYVDVPYEPFQGISFNHWRGWC